MNVGRVRIRSRKTYIFIYIYIERERTWSLLQYKAFVSGNKMAVLAAVKLTISNI